uniref:Uncharacterized protein n=1 Tax=Avena sativa TaxID=4498 RepID=A0ACD5W6E3_AVESA
MFPRLNWREQLAAKPIKDNISSLIPAVVAAFCARCTKKAGSQKIEGNQPMEGDTLSGFGGAPATNGVDTKVLNAFQSSFVQVQGLLDQNRVLINEINQNHESKVPGDLSRNVGLIRELNNNIRRVVELYANLLSI